MQTASVIVLGLVSLLLFALVQACAHDAVFGDGAGGGLSKSLIVLVVPLFIAAAFGLILLRQRGGTVSWPARTLVIVAALVIVGQAAAVKILLLGAPARAFTPVARVALAGGEALLLAMAWRGPATGMTQTVGALLLAVSTFGPLALLKPAIDRRAAAQAAFRLDEQARLEAERRPSVR